jgi:hypothetical protein
VSFSPPLYLFLSFFISFSFQFFYKIILLFYRVHEQLYLRMSELSDILIASASAFTHSIFGLMFVYSVCSAFVHWKWHIYFVLFPGLKHNKIAMHYIAFTIFSNISMKEERKVCFFMK